jgi:hypothetical protein
MVGVIQPLRSIRGLRRANARSGQIYFAFEVDERLLPFAIEEFGDQCGVYGSDIRTETAFTARSMSFSNETISARGASESCSFTTQRAFTDSKSWERDRLGLRLI